MKIDLTAEEIDTILDALKYSLQFKSNAEAKTYEMRQADIARIEAVRAKVSEAGHAAK